MSKFDETLELFREAPDSDYRADLLIEFAARYRQPSPDLHPRPYPAEKKVPGCESEVYVFADSTPDGALTFSFAVENPQGVSAKALAVFLHETLSGQPVEQIRQVQPEFVHELFGRTLSMGKGQGLMNMVNIVRHFSEQHEKSRSVKE